MRDYWFTQELLKAAGFGYMAVCVIALGLALWLPKRGWVKALMATIVLGIASVLPFIAVQEKKQEQVQVDDYKKRYNKAKAVFDEKCKTAGERIYKTVDNVEGILLMNVRKNHYVEGSYNSKQDPNWPDAGHPHEYGEESYIKFMFAYEYEPEIFGKPEYKLNPGERGGFSNYRSPNKPWISNGYLYVDVKQPDGTLTRIMRPADARAELTRMPIKGKPAVYAVSFENSLDPEERKHWIAGTKVKVTNTQTGELLAERQAYAFEAGFGSLAGHRQPWLFAITCPQDVGEARRMPTRIFVDQVLKPIQERK